MEGDPVNLHYEKTLYKEINPPNAVDPYLGLSGNARISEQHPGQGLEEGIRAKLHLGQHVPRLAATIAGQMPEKKIRFDVSPVVRTLHHDQRFESGQA